MNLIHHHGLNLLCSPSSNNQPFLDLLHRLSPLPNDHLPDLLHHAHHPNKSTTASASNPFPHLPKRIPSDPFPRLPLHGLHIRF